MRNPSMALRGFSRAERIKAATLFSWFFVLIATLWLLKPIRQASLLVHLGAAELPYVRFAAVAAVAVVVAIYSRLVDRLTRVQVARGAGVVFATLLVAFWIALRVGGEELGAQRWFVWAVFILVDIYSAVMVGIFWTYTNDVVTREQADRLYGPIGLGGILGGITGGVTVDTLVGWIGPVDMLALCAVLALGSSALVWTSEASLHPHPRPESRKRESGRFESALEGVRLVVHTRYLMLIVGIVVAYEFAAATTDFVVSVVLERAYPDQTELTQMLGRIGWIVSGVALVSQVLLVPLVLPRKHRALLLPPIAMSLATIGLAVAPMVVMAIVLAASDRGLNYSLQQTAKETLYVPLGDAEKYKAKAFIDMIIGRAGKAFSSIALMVMIAVTGVSIPISLTLALGALVVWVGSAAALGRAYARKVASADESPPLGLGPHAAPGGAAR